MRLWIFDKDDTPQGFPLARLLEGARLAVDQRGTERWIVTKSRGYGERVNALERLLRESSGVEFSFGSLRELALGTEEWFYDFDARCAGCRVGLHDSSAMFIDGVPEVVESISKLFQRVERAEVLVDQEL